MALKAKKLNAEQTNDLIGMAAIVYAKDIIRSKQISNAKDQVQMQPNQVFDFMVLEGDNKHKISLTRKDNQFVVTINGKTTLNVDDSFTLYDEVLNTKINSQDLTIQLLSRNASGEINLQYLGTKYKLNVFTQKAFDKLKYMPAKKVVDTSSQIISPMPGLVKSVTVKVGDLVSEGAEICTVEAMKMQNKLVASKQGKIKKVNTKVGESVEEGKVLVELE